MQTNWIGRSEGAEVTFTTEAGRADLLIFTTRPDTLWGATFMVLAPEHPLVDTHHHADAARRGRGLRGRRPRARRDRARGAADKEKTGVFTGAYAINPVNGERIPIWIADYVLMGYGTGAIMAVPAHDERDFEFARKYGLPDPPRHHRPRRGNGRRWQRPTRPRPKARWSTPAAFDGTPVDGAGDKVVAWLEETRQGQGARSTTACATG